MKVQERAEAIRSSLTIAKARAGVQIRELFPVGAEVNVYLGGHRIAAKITGHDWQDPLEVQCVNVVTGKKRKFTAGFDTVI